MRLFLDFIAEQLQAECRQITRDAPEPADAIRNARAVEHLRNLVPLSAPPLRLKEELGVPDLVGLPSSYLLSWMCRREPYSAKSRASSPLSKKAALPVPNSLATSMTNFTAVAMSVS